MTAPSVGPPRAPTEREALRRLARLLPGPPEGEVWFGDDAAVVATRTGGDDARARLLLTTDTLVGGIDADFALTTLADFGWKALAVNLSDIAAMGGTPGHALVSVVGLGPDGLEELYGGLLQAAHQYCCPVVGGDLSAGPCLVVTVAITGWVKAGAVLRQGARPGDGIWVTGPLGASAAGLRVLRLAHQSAGPGGRPTSLLQGLTPTEQSLATAHARPRPALAEGRAARQAGATAMTDVSDGLGVDLGWIADASGVGFELATVPMAPGASLAEAMGGGEDFVLVFTAPSAGRVEEAFAGLAAPTRIGTCVADPGRRLLDGAPLPAAGWEHWL